MVAIIALVLFQQYTCALESVPGRGEHLILANEGPHQTAKFQSLELALVS
jgi:hypothetical protein